MLVGNILNDLVSSASERTTFESSEERKIPTQYAQWANYVVAARETYFLSVQMASLHLVTCHGNGLWEVSWKGRWLRSFNPKNLLWCARELVMLYEIGRLVSRQFATRKHAVPIRPAAQARRAAARARPTGARLATRRAKLSAAT